MGGKTKQSQRTKNNVRPSSSGRSAEILSNTIKVDSSFLTVGPGKVLPALFPTLTATNIDQNLSPEYSVCFKKFNKKDPVTKTKALQELLELVKNGNVEEVVAALPSWAHYYQTLTIDTDRRVREAAQACHGAIISACGRQVAPHLRRLLPAWLLAQYDEHAPVSSLAQAQLASTFPEGKLSEAISFCKAEIIALLIDNLTGNAEAMLSNKVSEPEERESQRARVAAASLRALERLAAAPAHAAWLWPAAAPLLQAAAFWRLAAHDSPHVRACWYGCAARVPRGAGARALRALLALPERAPAPAARRWAALLLLARGAQEWHTWLDKKDLLVKRFLDLLENGGWGQARLVSDVTLPLLAKLPEELISKEFYIALFNALFTGLENKSILSSKTERQIWITNISECLRHLSVQPREYAAEAASGAHRAWLARALAAPRPARAHVLRRSAADMAALARYWLERADCDHLVRNFWQNIGSTISAQIEKLSVEENDITQLIDDHTLLLRTLKTSFDQDKKQLNIQFADEKMEKVDTEPKEVAACDRALTDRFMHNLNEIVERTCCQYFEFAHEKMMSRAVFSSLITLLVEFDSKNLFLTISRHFNADSMYSFYDKVLKSWLSGDTMRCEALVEVVFLLFKYFTEEEQENMYNSFQQFPPLVVEWCLARSLARAHSVAARRWLRGGAVQAAAAALARRSDERAHDLLLRCFAHDEAGEVLVNSAAVEQAVAAQCAALRAGGAGAAARAARLAAALAQAAGDARAAPLLADLFRLNLRVQGAAARAEARAAWRGALAAGGGARAPALAAALRDLRDHVYGGASMQRLDARRLRRAAALGGALCAAGAGAARLLAPPARAPRRPPAAHALRADCIFGNLNCPFEDENELIQEVVSDADKEHEELTKEDLMIYVHKSLFRSFFLRAMLTRNACLDEEDDAGEDAGEDARESTGEGVGGGEGEDVAGGEGEDVAGEEGEDVGGGGRAALLRDALYRDQFALMLEEFVVLNSLCERYAFWEHYDIIKTTKECMEKVIEDILSEIPTDMKNMLLSHLTEEAATRGYYWAFARSFLEFKMNQMAQKACNSQNQTLESPKNSDKTDVSSELETDEVKESTESDVPETQSAVDSLDMSKLEEIVTGTGYFHSLQAELKWGPATPARAARAERAAALLMLRAVLAAHARDAALAAALAADLRGGATALDAVVNAYYRHNHVMLYERDLNSAPWSQVVSNACIADALRLAVRRRGAELPAHVWDFATISLCSLVASLRASAPVFSSTKVALMARAVLELFLAVREFAGGARALALRRQLAPHALALAAEWDDIFAPDLNANLFDLLLLVLEEEDGAMTVSRTCVAGALAAAGGALQWERLAGAARARLAPARLAAAAGAALRRAPPPARAALAYAALGAVDKPLVLDDAEKLAAWNASDSAEGGEGAEGREGETAARDEQLSLVQLEEPLRHLHGQLDALLHDVEVMVDTYAPAAGSGAARAALAALLAAAALLRRARLARGDLHHCYVRLFRERKYASLVLPGALRLLPAAALRERVPPALLQHFRAPPAQPALDVYAVRRRGAGRAGGGRGHGGAGRGRGGARVGRRAGAARRRRAAPPGAPRRGARAARAPAGAAARARARPARHAGVGAHVARRGRADAERGGALADAVRAVPRGAPAGAAARGRRARRRRRARARHALDRALPRVSERQPAERGAHVGVGGARARGGRAAVLHLLLPPAARAPRRRRALPPVPQLLPRAVPAQVVRDEQQVQLPALSLQVLIRRSRPRPRRDAGRRRPGAGDTRVAEASRDKLYEIEHTVQTCLLLLLYTL